MYFVPENMRRQNWLFNNFKEASKLYGFVLESEDLFIRKASEEIRDQPYCFEDRGNRCNALKPEMTPSLVRFVLKKGQCWRYENMTRGLQREHYLWNTDISGVPKVMIEKILRNEIKRDPRICGMSGKDMEDLLRVN